MQASSTLFRWAITMVIIMTLETIQIISSCMCSDDQCQFNTGASNDALTSPAFPPNQKDESQQLERVYPNMAYAERIQTLFVSHPPVPFSRFCSFDTHTFLLEGGTGVSWFSRQYKSIGHQHRGKSLHCLLARAAERQPLHFSLRLSLGDTDPDQPYTLTPASTNRSHAFLFPDFTWESWPEVDGASSGGGQLTQAQRVMQSAERHGLPGSLEWKTLRDPRAMWRGVATVGFRQDLMNVAANSTDLMDVQMVILDAKGPPWEHFVSREDHCRYRFLIHLNGAAARDHRYSSALKWRFLCGSLVFLQTEPLFYEWWSVGMQPFVHFVPFTKPDELVSLIQEYKSTGKLEEGEQIAKAGYELAKRAFEDANDYVDTFLSQYQNLTAGIVQKPCRTKAKGHVKAKEEYDTLEQLRAKYGPTVCL